MHTPANSVPFPPPPKVRRVHAPETLPAPELLTVKQAAALLGISVRSLYGSREVLPPAIVLSAKAIRYRRTDLLAWIAALPAGDARMEPAHLSAARVRRRGEQTVNQR